MVRGKENLIISRVLDRFMLTDQLKRVNKRIIRTKLSKERREDVGRVWGKKESEKMRRKVAKKRNDSGCEEVKKEGGWL